MADLTSAIFLRIDFTNPGTSTRTGLTVRQLQNARGGAQTPVLLGL